MGDSRIAWTQATWNPITGCSKVSAGCMHCYAERMAKRLAGRFGYPAEHPFAVTLHPDRLDLPSQWRRPRRIFVDSMSDLFHPDVSAELIRQVAWRMHQAPRHVFQILTKRPERMRDLTLGSLAQSFGDVAVWADNVWLGVSIENQAAANVRIPLLLDTPATVRFVSAEPLLGPIDLRAWLRTGRWRTDTSGALQQSKLDWVIAGAESGPGARPMDLDWARTLRDDCQAAGVAFFFKQAMVDGRRVETPELDGVRWTEYPS